ncbi:MAG TPA: hypothetical protein VI603_18845, partial [Saprospiraceae bacterium]|nr:hypothetical protein [Saprospiraceae bacterium]
TDGRIVELSNDTYMKDFKSYPKEEWTFIEHTKTEPAIPVSKISDFKVMDADGNDVTADILENPEPLLLVISYKLHGSTSYVEEQVQDSVYKVDTIQIGDHPAVVRTLVKVDQKKVTKPQHIWDAKYVARFNKLVNPLAEAAAKEGISTYAVAGGTGAETIEAFVKYAGANYPMYEADDIILKTIMRSNPGLVLMKNGVILGKWHYRHFPDVATLKGLISK